jgi:hypothetical protein
VSGATSFSSVDRVRAHVAEVLDNIREEVLSCAGTQEARRVYDLTGRPSLRLISPLADGADRLVAEEASNFQLEVPLPFEIEAYKSTFAATTPEQHTASIESFERLLATARPRVLTMDGDRLDDTNRWRSYEAVGRLVVRNCDLLIAIWDDETPSRGRGGTADTVRYALRGGIPVWWIHASKDVSPRWLEDILDLPHPGAGETSGGQAHPNLRKYIRHAIVPPEPANSEIKTIWHRALMCLRRILRIQTDPLLAFLAESETPNRRYWNLHRQLIGILRAPGERRAAQGVELPHAKPTRTGPPTGPRGFFSALAVPFRYNQAEAASSPAAGLSAKYRDRYRTSYTVVFACAAVALSCAILGLALEAKEKYLACAEFLLLCIILGHVLADRLLRWHERYISYRMLGELLRMSHHLRALGWGLPGSRVNNLARGTRRDWVSWLFAATVRATPLVTGAFTEEELTETKRDIMENLIDGQLGFHFRREKGCTGAAHILGGCGRALFAATIVFVAIRALTPGAEQPSAFLWWLALFCALLPAASAAFFGLRAYEEFEVLAEQSKQMHEALTLARLRMGRIATDTPLASQVLGAELFEVMTIMLSDVTGWAQLFRMKLVDA